MAEQLLDQKTNTSLKALEVITYVEGRRVAKVEWSVNGRKYKAYAAALEAYKEKINK